MSKPFYRAFLLILLSWSITTPLLAREYIIEVILFANHSGKFQVGENLPAALQTKPSGEGVDLLREQIVTIESDTADQPPRIWRLLDSDQYYLSGVAKRLRSSANYTVLRHFSWQQPVVPKQQSLSLKIEAGRDFTDRFPRHETSQFEFSDQTALTDAGSRNVWELEGTIKVGISRYLHLYTDLVYRLPRKITAASERHTVGETILVDYPIRSHRRMRSKELHYIDHPLLGILVEARPVESEEE